MTQFQREILKKAPRFLYAYRDPPFGKELIPDTVMARQSAVERGATHFDTIPFHRFDGRGFPVRRGPGDFSFQVSHPRGSLEALALRVESLIATVNHWHLALPAPSSVVVTYIGQSAIQISVSHEFFALSPGFNYLPAFYGALADQLRVWAAAYTFADLVIEHRPRCVAPNSRRPDGRLAVAMGWTEFYRGVMQGFHGGLDAPRPCPVVSCPDRIDGNLKVDLITQVMRSAARDGAAAQGHAWRPYVSLIKAGACGCDPSVPERTIKCAIKLEAWLRSGGVCEFQGRDALRAVSGSFKWESGVAGALALLVAHGYLQECLFPRYSQPGRRPSRWFVVNPEAHSVM